MRREVKVGNVRLGPQERRNILKVMASDWVSPGPFVADFEKKFSAYHDCMYGVMMNSGTDALRIALLALKENYGWRSGSEIIVPALTFVATVNTVMQAGLKPVFVDVSPRDLNIDVSLLAKALTFNTAAILPVHLFGNPSEMDVIGEFAKSHGLRVLEDSCESMGVRFGERMVGSMGDIGAFSTYSCHLIQTGVGGIATTNDEDLYNLMRSYMNHGRRSEARKDRFVFDRMGYSSRPDEFQAAIGLAQIDELGSMLKRRLANAADLAKQLAREESLWIPTVKMAHKDNACMMFPIILNSRSFNRDEFCAALEEKGVETRPLFPLLTQPCYRQTGWVPRDFPVALRASQHGFYVGCHQDLNDEDMAYVADSIKATLRTFSKRQSVAA